MNSSKIFKKDSLFTPHSLIRQAIAAPSQKAEPVSSPEPPARAEQPAPRDGKQQPQRQQAVAELKPEPKPAPDPAPEPKPPPQPQIDVEAIRKEAYDQGAADLSARWQADVELTVQSLLSACQKIDSLRQQKLAGSHSDLINLVISLTEKILNQELATPRNIIATTLQTALEQAVSSEEFHVTLHPDDLAFAEEKAPELITAVRGLQQLVFKTDPTIIRGGCLLESVTCRVDATIDGQLECVREVLEEHPEILHPDETLFLSDDQPTDRESC